MPKKYVVVAKSIGRKWFLFVLAIIAIVAFVRLEAAMWITIIAFILLAISYLPNMIFIRKLTRSMKRYYMVEEDTIAKDLKLPLRRVKEKMFELTRKQNEKKKWKVWIRKKKWLIVFLNKHYIFFHKTTIDKFKDLYRKGYGDKEILESLKENDLRTKAELKIIYETLKKNNRLGEREVSVRERREHESFT